MAHPPATRRPQPLRIVELVGPERDAAIPILKESFTGYYRWHAKRTLREIATARAALVGGSIAGVALWENLLPEVGYLYYLFVGPAFRRHGVGAALLDDALGRLRRRGAVVVFAAAEAENDPSVGLLRSRGFRTTERKELGWKDGGLGAWGLRSRMRVIGGELVLGLRLDRPSPRATPSGRRRPRRPIDPGQSTPRRPPKRSSRTPPRVSR
ncbi:MAG TPA: GNAT family N-acetyltransferase [Thermoplasmata archaeon]|nr:GNAT family N-acetyltransferase [Thermoplasmata archaeon]